jgi:hypothetical protein
MAVTTLNLVLMLCIVAQKNPADAQDVAPVLKGRALEIVDEQGRTRASIRVHGPTTVDGQRYPEAVVFRLHDPQGRPHVKMDTSEERAGLGLSFEDNQGRISLMAKNRRGVYVEVIGADGRKQTLAPPR